MQLFTIFKLKANSSF